MLIRAASCDLVVPGLSARCVFLAAVAGWGVRGATGVVQLAGDGGAITLLRLPGVEVETAPDTAEKGLPAAGQALPGGPGIQRTYSARDGHRFCLVHPLS